MSEIVRCLEARWYVIRIAVLLSGCYLAWILVFERVLEPAVRRCVSVILRRPIVWVAAGAFRVWGIAGSSRRAQEATVALLGSGMVLCAALFPAVLLGCATSAAASDTAIAASSYLAAIPMAAVFVLRVLSG